MSLKIFSFYLSLSNVIRVMQESACWQRAALNSRILQYSENRFISLDLF